MKNLVCAVLLFASLTLAYCQTPQVRSGKQPGQRMLIVDVRSPAEYVSGHVPGSTNVPLRELSQRIGQVAADKQAHIAVHCQSGGRSAKAKKELEKLGYTNVKDLGSLANAREFVQPKSRAQ